MKNEFLRAFNNKIRRLRSRVGGILERSVQDRIDNCPGDV